MRTQEEIMQEIKELDEKINPLRDRRRKCEDELNNLLSPFHVGDIISYGDRRIRHGRVQCIMKYCEGLKYLVMPMRKDGVEGMKSHEVYPWDNPQLVKEKSK